MVAWPEWLWPLLVEANDLSSKHTARCLVHRSTYEVILGHQVHFESGSLWLDHGGLPVQGTQKDCFPVMEERVLRLVAHRCLNCLAQTLCLSQLRIWDTYIRIFLGYNVRSNATLAQLYCYTASLDVLVPTSFPKCKCTFGIWGCEANLVQNALLRCDRVCCAHLVGLE